jgi:hypothetical protein
MKKIVIPALVVAVATFIVSMIIGQAFNMLVPSLMNEYKTPGLFRPWDDPLMMMYFAYPLILGFIMAWLWDKTKTLFTGSTGSIIWNFAILFWLIFTLPGMFMTLSSFKISVIMVLSWTISNLGQAYIGALVVVKMNKKE